MDSPTSTVDTPSDRDVVVARTFAAPRALVLQAFTGAKRLAQRRDSADDVDSERESDARPGGSFRVVMRSLAGVESPFRLRSLHSEVRRRRASFVAFFHLERRIPRMVESSPAAGAELLKGTL